MASLQIITKYLALFHELYPTRDVSSVTAQAWEYACADVGDVTFQWAADRLLHEQGRTYFPTPNELRAHLANRQVETPARLQEGDAVGDAVREYYAKGGVRQHRLPDFTPRGKR